MTAAIELKGLHTVLGGNVVHRNLNLVVEEGEMLAIVGGRPKVLPLLDIVEHFIEFRREIIRRRTEFELRRAEGDPPAERVTDHRERRCQPEGASAREDVGGERGGVGRRW